jgi:hypothetical protein
VARTSPAPIISDTSTVVAVFTAPTHFERCHFSTFTAQFWVRRRRVTARRAMSASTALMVLVASAGLSVVWADSARRYAAMMSGTAFSHAATTGA